VRHFIYINYQKKAALIGAINTIKITKGKLKGYNTDYYGFKKH
jgi:shikimate dehydrogenase